MKFSIQRKQRDRKGGHQVTVIDNTAGVCGSTPASRKFVKQYTTKLLRRQHKTVLAAALVEYQQDVEWKFHTLAELDNDYYDWNDYDESYDPYEDERSLQDNYDSHYDDSYCYYADPGYEYTPYQYREIATQLDTVITRHEIGMTLGQLLRIHGHI